MNFNNGWVEVFTTGKHIDNEGRAWDITADFLESVADNYDPAIHEAPAVIGHPKENAPAFGWAKGLKVEGDRLLVQFTGVNPEFEQLVQDGSFKKRSASFYLDKETAPGGRAPQLRHVGFLGAQPPAVKGLRDIQFNANEGEALTFEITSNYSEGDMDEKQEQGLVQKILDGIKSLLPKKDEPGSPAIAASFTEADRKTLVEDVVKQTTVALTASFGDQLKERDTKITALQTQLGQQATTTVRTEIVAFTEKLGPAKFPPAFREMGLVEFMESLSASDQKVTVISFTEKDGQRVETKTETPQLAFFKSFLEKLGPFIEFGERFGSLNAKGNDDATAPDPKRMGELRAKAGLPATQGGTA